MKFHHVGLIVENISIYETKLIYEEKFSEVIDPIQKSKLALYKNFSDSYIELIEPLSDEAFTWNFLKSKNYSPYHHFCYETKNLLELDSIVKKYRLIPILGPVPATLFNGRMVSFYYTRNKTIVEFLI